MTVSRGDSVAFIRASPSVLQMMTDAPVACGAGASASRPPWTLLPQSIVLLSAVSSTSPPRFVREAADVAAVLRSSRCELHHVCLGGPGRCGARPADCRYLV